MKKVNLLLVLNFAIVGGLSFVETVQAEDSKSTEARVVVNPGDLKIKNVDGIQFADVQINGQDKSVTEKDGTKAKVIIEDFRGSNSKGWMLKAKLKEGNFNGLGLKFAPSIHSNTNSAVAVEETQNLNNQEVLIASIEDNKIVNSEFDTEVQLNAMLSVPAKMKANTYSATIIWNLAATPETKNE